MCLRTRRRAGLTQAQVAEALGISDETLSRLERGVQWPDFATFAGLAKVYGKTWADLMAVHPATKAGQREQLLQEVSELLADEKPAQIELARDVLRALLRK